MRIKYYPYTLNLRHTFTISTYSRISTPALLIEIEENGIIGYGEISMPQYLAETVETAGSFLEKVNPDKINLDCGIAPVLDYIDSIDIGNTAAKAGLDIAFHDLYGKILSQPVRRIYDIAGNESPKISFTIGIDTEENLIKKLAEAEDYELLKIKLGSDNDRQIIKTIRNVTEKKIIVDVNQGWKIKEEALEIIHFLQENGVLLIEQPLDKNRMEDQLWLKERSPLPLFADEALQRLSQLREIKELYHGINIKLMKCTGIREAFVLIKNAKSLGLQTMIGCMTETSCAISAAAQLAPLTDFADLDGNLLIKNDPFRGLAYKEGRIIVNDLPGLGVEKIN